MKGENRGFTIIEVVLFLAISAALFVVAFRYTSNTVRVTQYNDVVKTFEAFLEQQYNRAQTGNVTSSISLDTSNRVNCQNNSSYVLTTTPVTGTVTKGYSDSCLVLGVLIDLRYDAVSGLQDATVFPVLGYAGGITSGTDETVLNSAQPTVWGQKPIDKYVFPSGFRPSSQSQAWLNKPASSTDTGVFEKLAFLKSPSSGTMLAYAFSNPAWDPSAAYGSPASASNLATNIALSNLSDYSAVRNPRGVICITSPQSPGLQGVIKLEGNNGRGSFGIDSISSSLDTAGSAYWTDYLPTSLKYTGVQC